MLKTFYFGDSRRQLFGAYHSAQGAPAEEAVLLCNAGLEDYNASHWAYRKLAAQLAAAGRSVLRFDYSGSGDSAGGTAEATPETWLADLHTAARELLDQSGLRALSVVGRGVGATLAAQACADGLAVRQLVLWEPVVRGADHLAALARLHKHRLRMLLHDAEPGAEAELLGYAFTPAARRGIAALDLRASLERTAVPTSIFLRERTRACDELLAALPQLSLEIVDLDPPAHDDPDAALLPANLLAAIAKRLAAPAPPQSLGAQTPARGAR